MFRNLALILAVTLSSTGSFILSDDAIAATPLSRAVIESLRNQVRLIPKNQSARPARRSDTMTGGDALATARSSMAQLRFNDGSLARVGAQAVFKFTPGTRTFRLSNGTALMLIPPGRGTTRVRTPNAAAGIRGSALFVRYIPETDTTIVGALTTSGIEVFNNSGSQSQELQAGHMAVIVKDRIEKVYEFDLNTFYQTSELAAGLDLNQLQPDPSADEAIAQVQAETAQGLKTQSPFTGTQVIENPSFVQLSDSTSAEFPDINRPVLDDFPTSLDQNPDQLRNTTDVRSILQGGEIRRDTQSPSGFPNRPGTDDRPGRDDRPDNDNNGRGNQGVGNNPDGPGGNGNNGQGNQGVGNNPDGPGGNGNNGQGNQGVGNNPDGPGGNGNNGQGNQGVGNNPDGPGGNGNGRNRR